METKKRLMLLEKGWTEQQLRKAQAALETAEKHDPFFAKIVFWTALLVTVFANLMVSLVLIPFLIVFSKAMLYSIVILLALCIGSLYRYLIMNIGHLERKHHLLASVITPVLALANMVMMVVISNNFIKELQLQNSQHNPWIIGMVFAVAFILPTLIFKIFQR